MDISNMRFPSALSVSEVNKYIKDLFDLNPPLTDIYIKGEISNFKAHSSGHMYFSLKDEESALRCVMFRSGALNLAFRPENGMKVTAHGRISAFVRDGAYQLYADSMEPDGVGSLYIAYKQLKQKLESEGLFSPEHKKPIPKIPSRVGVVTSQTGAAVRDIINVCKRRFPYAHIIVYPALVQGDGAVKSVSSGIRYFNDKCPCDVIIVGRGGGSIEDLWAFNSELVARSVFESRIPVISAVGHETDFTICDFVADKRAPTPSAAAELAVPEIGELKQKFRNIISRESVVLKKRISYQKEKLVSLGTSRVLSSPKNYVEDRRMSILALSDRMERAENNLNEKKKAELAKGATALNALNPLAVLSRGYCAAFSEGRVVKSVADTCVGEVLELRFGDGAVSTTVNGVCENE